MAAIAGALFCGGSYFALSVQPEIGAQGAELLRRVVGQEAVAQLETTIYDEKDQVDRWLAQAGLKQAQAPWKAPEPTPPPTETRSPVRGPLEAQTETPSSVANTPGAQFTQSPIPTAMPQAAWKPPVVSPFGALSGEGVWQPYIVDASGRTVAYRTFVMPDDVRRYVVVGVVAFDLRATQLHFVLGSEEPKSSVAIERTGRIPTADAQPGRILSVFNGGFKADHGQYGAMFNHTVVLPPITDHMTVAMYPDGTVHMGTWGREIADSDQALWWRQNGPPIIHLGQVNPLTSQMTARNWGASINGSVAVWRSGLGLSQDGRVLYYAAGDSLVVLALARGLQAAGAYNAMQLDVNNYWVYFGAVKAEGTRLTNEALFEQMKGSDPRRYLNGFGRDYFYVTLRE
jgi:Phosphodiester glycosidase